MYHEFELNFLLVSRNNKQPSTYTRREYEGKTYVKNIRKNSCRIQNQLKSRIRIRKKSFRINNTVPEQEKARTTYSLEQNIVCIDT
jgi:hypothetical protein